MWFSNMHKSPLAAVVAVVGLLGVDASSQSRGPLSSIQVVRSPVINSPSHRINAYSHFDLEFEVKDRKQRVKLILEPNHDIIPNSAGITYLNADGEPESWEPLDRTAYRIFKGAAWVQRAPEVWDNLGWARINILQDGEEPIFEGSFSIMHDSHHIQLRHKFEQTRHNEDPKIETAGEGEMILFRDSDTTTHPWHGELRKREQDILACSADDLSFNTNPFHPVHQSFSDSFDFDSVNSVNASLARRQSIDGGTQSGNAGNVNYRNTIGQTLGCPNTRKVALVGVAIDCSYRSGFSNRNATAEHVIGVMNQASQVYEQTFNITLGLKNLTIQEPDCPSSAQAATPWNLACDSSLNITSRLNTFSAWRGQYQDDNAYWMLLTNCTTGPEVGLSWLGQLCVNSVSNVGGESTSGANVVARTSSEWQVIAHETGHMFGAVHDCDQSLCASSTAVNAQQCCPLSTSSCDAGGQYIMNPSTGTNIQSFSACTVGNICSAFYRKSVSNECLVDNRGVPELITGQQCGNGIVEGDEECDCGGETACEGNKCCDPKTCKFLTGAVCDDANEQCCSSCQFAAQGTICRASTGSCDPQEVCPGTNATCPPDQTAPNGQSCGNNLQCASGQCTSRDLQCKTLMGSLTTNNDTYACDSNSCTLLCASPEFPANECYSMQQYFLDGTPCGSGTCSNGVCSGSSTGGDIVMFVNNNKTIFIGVGAGVGGLIVLCILICCFRRCVRRKKQPLRGKNGPSPTMQQQWPGAAGTWAQPAPPRYGGAPAHGVYSVPAPNVPGYGQYSNQGPRGVPDQNPDITQDTRRPPMFYGGHSVRYA